MTSEKTTTGVTVLGTGFYVPEQAVKNADYAAFVETSDEWITTRTGMKKRHIATDEPTWKLGSLAGKMALENSGLASEDIDMVLVTTVTSDFITPAMACLIQQELAIPSAMALDINVACTAFCFAVDMARRYLVTGDVEHVLLVSAESLSQITNYQDRATCVLFGDGAGACVLGKNKNPTVYGSFQDCDASGAEYIHAKHSRKTHPFNSVENNDIQEPFPIHWHDLIYMNGREVYKFATRAMPDAVEAACRKAGVSVSDLSLIIPHQANLRIVEAASKRLGVPAEKIFTNIDKYGNTSSASCAIGLHEAVTTGAIAKGDLVCLVGFGAGLTYGATIFTY